MFDECGNVTDVSSLFFNSLSGKQFAIYGNNYIEGESGYYMHQGLFTPLVSCINFDNIFGNDNSHERT
jgi:hypothetical protein